MASSPRPTAGRQHRQVGGSVPESPTQGSAGPQARLRGPRVAGKPRYGLPAALAAPRERPALLRRLATRPLPVLVSRAGGRACGITTFWGPSADTEPRCAPFPHPSSPPQAERRSPRPPPRPAPHRQARHDLHRAAVAEVASGLRRRLGHGHRHLLQPPARRPPLVFAAPSLADAPAYAHAWHARHAVRGAGSAGAKWAVRKAGEARATVAAEGQTKCGRLQSYASGRARGQCRARTSLLGNPHQGTGAGPEPGPRRSRGGARSP